MSPLKKLFFFIIVAAQIVVLVVMIVRQETLLAQGTKIVLSCKPIDPRSLFSGDYVILNFDISRIDKKKTIIKAGETFKDNQIVYVGLVKDPDTSYHQAAEISGDIDNLRSKYPVIIRGTVAHPWGDEITVTYGLEQFFVPQNQGKDIERNLAKVSVTVSVDSDGRSALSRLYIDDKEVSFY